MKTVRCFRHLHARLFCGQFCLIASAHLIFGFPSGAVASPEGDAELCRQNLIAVFRAIEAYRHECRRLPEQLRDLIPQYLPEAQRLVCPATRHALKSTRSATIDIAHGAYVYEFEPKLLTNALAQSLGVTLRSSRQLQLGRIGSDVPMVRCTNHSPVLNLSFGGAIYESGLVWEDRFSEMVRPHELSLDQLLASHVHLEVIRLPARESGTPPELVDLTPHYNGSLNGWLEWSPEENLAGLPAGRTSIGGVTFDARGVIQLGSSHYAMLHRPAAASNIMVGLRCRSLVFLHGAVHGEGEGIIIGQYVIHFEDGSSDVVPLAYGRDLRHWQAVPDKGMKAGSYAVPRESKAGRAPPKKQSYLYAVRWLNPKPGLMVHRLDFLSAVTNLSAPFLVAVSAETTKRRDQTAGDTNKR